MDEALRSLLGMYELIGSCYTKDNFVLARAEKRTHSSLDGLEDKIEEWSKVPLA